MDVISDVIFLFICLKNTDKNAAEQNITIDYKKIKNLATYN